MRVSILLILDMLLEVWFSNCTSDIDVLSFNPSYTGYATGSFHLGDLRSLASFVSILLILDMLLEVSPIRLITGITSRCFNPSYTGYATGRIVIDWLEGKNTHCFNPSYTGYATGSPDVRIAS